MRVWVERKVRVEHDADFSRPVVRMVGARATEDTIANWSRILAETRSITFECVDIVQRQVDHAVAYHSGNDSDDDDYAADYYDVTSIESGATLSEFLTTYSMPCWQSLEIISRRRRFRGPLPDFDDEAWLMRIIADYKDARLRSRSRVQDVKFGLHLLVDGPVFGIDIDSVEKAQ